MNKTGAKLCMAIDGGTTNTRARLFREDCFVSADSRPVGVRNVAIGGELMQAIAEHTILASSVDWPPPDEPRWSAIDDGATFVARWGMLRGAFAVRLADVVVGMERSARTWFFVGVVAGSDWSELWRWHKSAEGIPLLVGGRVPLRGVYGRLAKSAWLGPVEILDESIVDLAAARGAIAIAASFAG